MAEGEDKAEGKENMEKEGGEGRRARRTNSPQTNRHRKRPLRLLAIPMHSRAHRRAAALGDVPGRARLRVLWVAHVGRGLRVDADGVEGCEDGVDDEAEERHPAVADEHDDFDDGDEH